MCLVTRQRRGRPWCDCSSLSRGSSLDLLGWSRDQGQPSRASWMQGEINEVLPGPWQSRKYLGYPAVNQLSCRKSTCIPNIQVRKGHNDLPNLMDLVRCTMTMVRCDVLHSGLPLISGS